MIMQLMTDCLKGWIHTGNVQCSIAITSATVVIKSISSLAYDHFQIHARQNVAHNSESYLVALQLVGNPFTFQCYAGRGVEGKFYYLCYSPALYVIPDLLLYVHDMA